MDSTPVHATAKTPPSWILVKCGNIHAEERFDLARIQFIFEWAVTKGYDRGRIGLEPIPTDLWGKIGKEFMVLRVDGEARPLDQDVLFAYEQSRVQEPPGADSEAYLIFKTAWEWQRKHFVEISERLLQIQKSLSEMGIRPA